MRSWKDAKVLIVGMTYPQPHRDHLDTVCTGGVTDTGEWIRLYPIPYRYLDEEKRFRMFSWLQLRVAKNPKDKRAESHNIDGDSITVVGHEKEWAARRTAILRLLSPSLEDLMARNKADPHTTSMGLVEIEYEDFYWKPTSGTWTPPQLREMKQLRLVGPQRKPLEKMPYELRLKFRCRRPECPSHDMNIFTWEYCQTFRAWRDSGRYGDDEGVLRQMKAAMLDKKFNEKNDTYLLLGTMFRYPTTWVIGSIFAPPKTSAGVGRLF